MLAAAILAPVEVVFRPSAFKHGYAEYDLYEVIASRPIKRRSQRGISNVYELFGRNFAGDYLHIVYRREGDRNIIFHIKGMSSRQKEYYKRHRK